MTKVVIPVIFKEVFERYDLIRCVVAADAKHPPIDLAKSLVDEMVENMALVG